MKKWFFLSEEKCWQLARFIFLYIALPLLVIGGTMYFLDISAGKYLGIIGLWTLAPSASYLLIAITCHR